MQTSLSVITPVHALGPAASNTIASVFRQRMPGIDQIVVGAAAAVRGQLPADVDPSAIHWIESKATTSLALVNEGLAAAAGDAVSWLLPGDLHFDDTLTIVARAFASDPLLDVAIACRHWVPFKDPADLTDGFEGVDQRHRFTRYCEAYGLPDDSRPQVIDHGLDFLDRALVTMRAKAHEGLPLYVAVWERGYEKQNRRSHEWLRRFGESITR